MHVLAAVPSPSQSCRRYRDLAIVYLMRLCGLRSLEVLLLELDDVSLDALRLKVRGKGGKERGMPIPELLRRLLARYLDLERPESAPTKHFFVVLKGGQAARPPDDQRWTQKPLQVPAEEHGAEQRTPTPVGGVG